MCVEFPRFSNLDLVFRFERSWLAGARKRQAGGRHARASVVIHGTRERSLSNCQLFSNRDDATKRAARKNGNEKWAKFLLQGRMPKDLRV